MNTRTRWIRRWRMIPLLIIVLIFSVGSSFRADSDCGLGSCSEGACDALVEGCAAIAVSGCIQALGEIHCSRGCGQSKSAKADASTRQYPRSLLADFAPSAWKGHLYTLTHHSKDILQPHWQALQQGTISFAEFSTLLQTIRTGAWNTQTFQQPCKKLTSSPDAVCYRYQEQWKQLVPSNDRDSIPSVFAEYPIKVYLKQDPENELQWQGRVDSQTTPHLPGFPAISLRFHTHPASDARVFLSKLSLTSAIGGKYTLSRAEASCHPSFAAHNLPWLVDYRPQFTEMVSAQGQWPIRRECYQRDVPIPSEQNKEDEWNQNLLLNQTNPLTNGQMLFRTFELKQGVLIDNRTMLLFHREFWTPSLSKHPIPYEGWIVLHRDEQPPSPYKPEDFVGNPVPVEQSCQHSHECASDSHCRNQRCVFQIQRTSVRTTLKDIRTSLAKASLSPLQENIPPGSSNLRNAFLFPGHQLEHRGVEWVGEQAFRLYQLYQSRQTHQRTLEQFFVSAMTQPSPSALEEWSQELGVNLARTAVQKAQILLTIAEQYKALRLPRVTCQVIQHAITATHLERMLLYRLFTSATTPNPQAVQVLLDSSVVSKIQAAFLPCTQAP